MAVEIARENGQPLMVDFYADWCVACQHMDYTTLVNEDVVELSLQFQNVKLDANKDEAAKKLKNDVWQVGGMPSYIFITASQIETTPIELLLPDAILQGKQSASRFSETQENVISEQVSDFILSTRSVGSSPLRSQFYAKLSLPMLRTVGR